MAEPIVIIDTSEIRDGKLADLELAIRELVEFVEANEPRPIAYSVHLSQDRTEMSVLQIHPDSGSLEFHLKKAGPSFQRFEDLIKMSAKHVYGQPRLDLLDQMRRKAEMLGTGAVNVHELRAGFARFALHSTSAPG